MKLKNYYKEGVTAFEKKTKTLSECPYVGLAKFKWEKGWNAAQNEAAEEWAMDQVNKNR